MARRVQVDLDESRTHMKAGLKEVEDSHESGSDTDEETMEIEAENNMKACILLSDLLCLHKKAFEASSELAAQPTLAALGEKIGDAQSEEMRELECVGDLLEILVSHPVHAKQNTTGVNGLWKDGSSRFYSGAVIDIKEDLWNVRGFEQENGTKFCRDPHGLVERRHDGHEKRMSLSLAPDNNGLVISHNGQKFNLQVYYDWDRWEHFDVLSKVWGMLNACTIGWIVVESGPHANKFVHSLTVQVPPELAGNLSLVTLPSEDLVTVLPGDLAACRSEDHFKKMLPAEWRKKQKHHSCWQNRFLHHLARKYQEKTPVMYYYCGVQGLFDYPGRCANNTMDHVEIMLYLEMPPDSTLMFTTPLGQAISANTWKNAFPQFVWQRSMDVVFQVLLSYFLAPAARHIDKTGRVLPDRLQFLLIEFLMLRNLLNSLLEVALMVKLWTKERDDYNIQAVIPLPLNSVTLMRFAIEIYSIGWGFLLAWDYGAQIWQDDIGHGPLTKGCLVKHPMGLSVLIFIKFLQFMMALLNFKMFRTSLLPTWFAIKSKESATFLLYMVVLTFGCALAYMALPYASTLEKEDDNLPLMYFRPFFLMFRLNIMGDFSVEELMGKDSVLRNSTDPAKNYAYIIDGDGPESHRLGPFLELVICLLALMFPVIFLNVYVGLVGEAYSNVKSNLLQISNSYVVTSVHRELLHRQFWRSVCGGICSFDGCRRPVHREGKGTFIRLPSALASEPLEVAS